MPDNAVFLITIGALLLSGLAADYIGRRTVLPRVTVLLLFGMLLGRQGLDLIPASVTSQFNIITVISLVMVGFLLGGKLTAQLWRRRGKVLLWVSLLASLGAVVLVALSVSLLGWPLEVAIILGCIAAATAPAATIDAVQESASQSHFAQLLLGIVAIDDAWALIFLTIGLAVLSMLLGAGGVTESVLHAVRDIGGGMLLGLLLGYPAALFTGRLRPGRPMLLEALGLVFLAGGLALWLEVSFIIAAMVMGSVIANRAVHHDYPFHEIENIEWPFLVVFFVLAGASLELGHLAQLGMLGIVFIGARVAGKLGGAWLGAISSDAPTPVRRWMGLALLPQAGVAIGMALLAADRFPEYGSIVLAVVTGSTVLFELFGPLATRIALNRAARSEARSQLTEETARGS